MKDGSACGGRIRDKGKNQAWMWAAVDLDGNLRIDRKTVDMGACERIRELRGTLMIVH